MTNLRVPASVPLRGNATALAHHERSRIRAAALHGRRLYPGPLGELVHRELTQRTRVEAAGVQRRRTYPGALVVGQRRRVAAQRNGRRKSRVRHRVPLVQWKSDERPC